MSRVKENHPSAPALLGALNLARHSLEVQAVEAVGLCCLSLEHGRVNFAAVCLAEATAYLNAAAWQVSLGASQSFGEKHGVCYGEVDE